MSRASFYGLLAASSLVALDTGATGSNGHHFGRYSYGSTGRHRGYYTKPGCPHKADRTAKRRAAKAGRRANRKHK